MRSAMLSSLAFAAQAFANVAIPPPSSGKDTADAKKYECLGDPDNVPGLTKQCKLALLDIADMGRDRLPIKADTCKDLSNKFGCIITVCNYYADDKVINLKEYMKGFEETLLKDCARHGQDGRWSPDGGPLDRVDPKETKDKGMVMLLEIHGDDSDGNDEEDDNHDDHGHRAHDHDHDNDVKDDHNHDTRGST